MGMHAFRYSRAGTGHAAQGEAMDVEDGGGSSIPYVPINLTHYQVEIDGLDEFRSLLGRELDTNLRPAAERIFEDHGLGAAFGRGIPGHDVRLAREKYRYVLDGSIRMLAIYIAVAEHLTQTLAEIADEYRDADLTSAAMGEAIRARLDDATRQAKDAVTAAEEEQRQLAARQNRVWGGGVFE